MAKLPCAYMSLDEDATWDWKDLAWLVTRAIDGGPYVRPGLSAFAAGSRVGLYSRSQLLHLDEDHTSSGCDSSQEIREGQGPLTHESHDS
jgi:hypothetical protein